MSNEMVTSVFQEIGKKYGYENVAVDWIAFKALKVQWQKSYNWIAFRLSDYLKEAPVEVWTDLAETLFGNIAGLNVTYGDPMKDYVLAPEFSQKHRDTYIKRGSRYISNDSVGENTDLLVSLNRLIDAGLIEAEPNIKLVWNKDGRSDLAGSYSVLMRTIMVNSVLDEKDIPDFLLDYVVYHQYLRIQEGTRTFGTDDMPLTRDNEKKFGRYAEAENALDKLCLVLC